MQSIQFSIQSSSQHYTMRSHLLLAVLSSLLHGYTALLNIHDSSICGLELSSCEAVPSCSTALSCVEACASRSRCIAQCSDAVVAADGKVALDKLTACVSKTGSIDDKGGIPFPPFSLSF
jgi:hypothetical protein